MTSSTNTGVSTLSVEIEFAVEFYDVDLMQVVWHGNYIKYFEKARCALLNGIGYGYRQMEESGYAFPVTSIDVKYIAPLRFGDTVRARATLTEYENRLRIVYELRNAATGVLTTRGRSTQMVVNMQTGSTLFECPPVFTDAVLAHLRQQTPPSGAKR